MHRVLPSRLLSNVSPGRVKALLFFEKSSFALHRMVFDVTVEALIAPEFSLVWNSQPAYPITPSLSHYPLDLVGHIRSP